MSSLIIIHSIICLIGSGIHLLPVLYLDMLKCIEFRNSHLRTLQFY